MASASTCSISRLNYPSLLCSLPSFSLVQFQFSAIKCQSHFKNSTVTCTSSGVSFNKRRLLRPSKLRAVAEEEGILVPEQETSPPDAAAPDQTVSVAVSPSDVLTMFFQVGVLFRCLCHFNCSMNCLNECLV